MAEPRHRALRLIGLLAAVIAVAAVAYVAGSRRGASAVTAAPSSSIAERTSVAAGDPPAPRGDGTQPALRAPDLAAAPAGSSASITIPLPARLGGGKEVAPSTRAVAQRLGLVPEELQDLALARGGSLPPPVVSRLDDAYGRGLSFAQRLAVDPQKDDVVANRFANQLVRIDREMRRSPPGASLDEVVAAVTHDTLEDLARNVDRKVADAAKPELAALRPLEAAPAPQGTQP